MESLGSRLWTSGWWGTGTGFFFFLWALGARAVGRLDPGFTTFELALRYIGLSLLMFLGMGVLAPLLRRRWAATVYAGAFGLAFTVLAVSLVSGVGSEWIVIASVFTIPLASLFFSNDVRSGATTLCGCPAAEQASAGEGGRERGERKEES